MSSLPADATPTATTPPSATGTVSGTGGAGLNCRTGAGTGYAIITALREGQALPIRGPMVSGWLPVICNGRDGFVLGTYLHVNTAPPIPTRTPSVSPSVTRTPTPPAPTTGQGVVVGTGGLGVNCRSGAGTAHGVIAVVAEGTTVPVRGPAQAGWVPVRCGGRDGWISAAYLRVTSIAALPAPTAERPSRRRTRAAGRP